MLMARTHFYADEVDRVVVGDGDESAHPSASSAPRQSAENFQISSVLALLNCAKTSDEGGHRGR